MPLLLPPIAKSDVLLCPPAVVHALLLSPVVLLLLGVLFPPFTRTGVCHASPSSLVSTL